jgi:hypothetical protein
MRSGKASISTNRIESCIHEVRGRRVIFDYDLAALYAVETRVLLQAMRRNPRRFPDDFAFCLRAQEVETLKSQSVILKPGGRTPGGRRRGLPWVFTEHGAVMAANVLRSPVAIDMSVHVVRAFVRTRRELSAHAELAEELQKLRRGIVAKFGDYDERFRVLFKTIERLIAEPPVPRKRIGFLSNDS